MSNQQESKSSLKKLLKQFESSSKNLSDDLQDEYKRLSKKVSEATDEDLESVKHDIKAFSDKVGEETSQTGESIKDDLKREVKKMRNAVADLMKDEKIPKEEDHPHDPEKDRDPYNRPFKSTL